MRTIVSFFILGLAGLTGCSSSRELDRATAQKLVQEHEDRRAANNPSQIGFYMVRTGIPKAIFTDPDQPGQLQRLIEANRDFYHQLVAKGMLKEEPTCNFPTSSFAPHRKYFCFEGSNTDFVNEAPDPNPDGHHIWVVISRPVYSVTGVSTNGTQAEAEVEIKPALTAGYNSSVSLMKDMDQKYADVKDARFVFGPLTQVLWANLRADDPQLAEQLKSKTRRYYFEKFDDGWRLHPMD